jgi:hypothetical protein
MKTTDVTNDVRTGATDDEAVPLLRCVCGQTYPSWDMILSVYADEAKPMPCCGRRLYFVATVKVFEVLG